MVGVSLTEHKHRSSARVVHELGDTVSQPMEGTIPSIKTQDEQGKHELQSQTPAHCTPVDLLDQVTVYRPRTIYNRDHNIIGIPHRNYTLTCTGLWEKTKKSRTKTSIPEADTKL